MGGDGGTYATSRKFVRGANHGEGKDEAKNVKQQQLLRTRQCAMSGEVSCLRHTEIVTCNDSI
jgi:hypothetical protein